MEPSEFQFSEPYLVNLRFRMNNAFHDTGEDPIEVNLQIENVIKKHKDNPNAATVDVTVSMGEDDTLPFKMTVTMRADFSWEEGTYDDDTLNVLLKQNATATLLSYIRPIVSMTTNASPVSVYNIPYIDLTKGGFE